MNKLYKRLFREIGSSIGQFLSIVLIIAVGAMLMSGMFSFITAIDNSTPNYYTEQNMADVWVYFKGISQEEAVSFENISNYVHAEGRYSLNGDTQINGVDCTLRLHSLTDITRPLLTEGVLPTNSNEIILDYKFAGANHLTIGSSLLVNGKTLTVSGMCMNPEYAYKQKDASVNAMANRTFGIAYTQKEAMIELIKASDAYIELVEEAENKINEAQVTIDDAKIKLSDAENSYIESRAEADRTFAENEQRLAETKEKLDAAQTEFNKQEKQASDTLTKAQAQLLEAQNKLDVLKAQLDAQYAEYMNIKDSLLPEQQVVQDKAFETKYSELASQQEMVDKQENELSAQKIQADNTFSQKQAELTAGYVEYEKAVSELNEKKVETYLRFDEAKAEIDENKAELIKQEAEVVTARQDAEQELLLAAEKYQEVLFITDTPDAVIAAAQEKESYISSVKLEDQISYVSVSGALDPIRSVAYIFPLIFFFVAAAVAFISISKTVENQRTQIAVMQALGISKAKVRLTFLSYAGLASIAGAVPFSILGNQLIPKLLIRVFMNRFSLPETIVPIYPAYVLFPLGLAVLFCFAATLLAVKKVLKEVPAQAMRPRPPKKSKTILVERFSALWNRLGYSNKLILRNLFLNKGRFLLSSIGVIGSVALILTGLSLRNSALDVVNTTMNSMSYDLSVAYKEPIKDVRLLSFGYPAQEVEASESGKATLKLAEDVSLNLQIIESGTSLVHLFDESGKQLDVNENSMIIPDTVAHDYGLTVGDTLTVEVDEMEYQLVISDVSVQYASKTLYLSAESAETAGMDVKFHTALIKLNEASDAEVVSEVLLKDETVKSVSTKEGIINKSKELLQTLNAVIVLILAAAAILSVTVIYNITSINIFERTREYATLMVLGYYKKEVNRLTMVENITLTGLGCLVGLPLGYWLFTYLAGIISASNLRIPVGLDSTMAVITILLAFAFTLLSNFLLRPKIKNIVLVEALKSVE